MIDPFVIAAPILLLAVVALLQFIGCDRVFGVTYIPPATDDPTFDPPEGSYSGPQMVALSDATSGATIFFTLDDTDPSTSVGGSTQQFDPASPIPVSSHTIVSAIATAPNDSKSNIVKATYDFAPIQFQQYKDELQPAGPSVDTVATPGFDNPVQPGSLMVVWIWYNTTGQSVHVDHVIDSDMNMNYARAAGPNSGGPLVGYQQEIWYGIVASGGANFTVTAQFSAAFTGEKGVVGHEFSGADQTSPLVQPGITNSGNTAGAACGPLPAPLSGLVFAAAIFGSAALAGAGFTQMSGIENNVSEYQIPTAAGPITAIFTNPSETWIAQMATFK